MSKPTLEEILEAAEAGWGPTIRMAGRLAWATRWVYLATFAIWVAFQLLTRALP